jgi:hypothetical protein
MMAEQNGKAEPAIAPVGGLAGWLLKKLRVTERSRPRLALLERIALAPRHSLALVEAEGAPAFYPLDEPSKPGSAPVARISW